MKKRVTLDGNLIRQQREGRAWTQEELSERSQLGVRTVRRLEAGVGSLATWKRVAEALATEAEVLPVRPLEASAARLAALRREMQVDPVELELGLELACLVEEGLLERVSSMRRHLAQGWGFVCPGVRVRDTAELAGDAYRVRVRGRLAGEGRVEVGRWLAVGRLPDDLEGERTVDPTYGMPAVWVAAGERARVDEAGGMLFDAVSVIVTHLTEVVKGAMGRLLSVDEVQQLLEALGQPVLVGELVPGVLSLAQVRSVLQGLLTERVSIRDLALILESLLECPGGDLLATVRGALAESICADWANAEGELHAVVVRASSGFEERLRAELGAMAERGLQPLMVTSPELRGVARAVFPGAVALSFAEIAPGFTVRAVATLE